MSTEQEDLASAQDVQYCFLHPKVETKLRCTRCDRPICGRCAIPASVGQHCPECVAEARKTAPKVKTVMQATAPAVRAIIIACVGVFVLQLVGRGVDQALALIPAAVDDGQWYRLISSTFVHGGALHIFFNMYVLYLYGPIMEQALGTATFAFLYLFTGLAASIASYTIPPETASVGASGAVFGVVGILIAYLYRRRRTTFMGQYLRGMLGFVAFNVVLGFLPGLNIDWVAHLGGLAAGLVLGFGFDAGKGTEARSPAALRLAVTLVVTGAMAALVMMRLG